MILDSHVHFDSFAAAGAVDGVLQRAADAGVHRMVAIGGNGAANALAVRLAEQHPDRLRAVVGFDRDQATAAPAHDELTRLAESPLVVGVGETGLDYHYEPHTAREQRALLDAMLAFAAARTLPVVLHNRDSDDDMLDHLRAHAAVWKGDPTRIGVLHCYTGGEAMARQLLDLGFHISFSGIVTFRNADPLRAVAKMVPADRLLVETDAPYLAPVPCRGQTNEPALVRHVVALVAQVRGENPDELANRTTENASRLFGWPL